MYTLMTPGPTMVRENVRQARSLVVGNPDIDPDFYDFYRDTCRLMSDLLHTKDETLILGGEGILALEAACASLTEPGDRVLVLDNGVFGRGFEDFVRLYGGTPVLYTVPSDRPIDPEALTTATKHILGFAYAYRASFYLDLVRLYEFKENKYTSADGVLGLAVPIVTETTTEAEAKANPRASAADVYEKVIFPDLEKAATYLSDYSATDPYTPSLAMVYGLQARAYLERGTADNNPDAYKKAAEYARKAITTSGCTPLTQAQWEDPTTGFNSATANKSWIWGLPLTSDNVSNLLNFQAHIGNEESWGYGHQVGRAIDKALYNKIDDKDFRKHSWLDPDRNFYAYKSCRPNGSAYFATLKDYVNIKFRPAQGNYTDFKVGGATDIPCMRVEEMYLIEAEATAQSNIVAARELLNEFMKYRFTDGSYDCSERTPTLKSFIEELILQKRIEFWGEGIIMFDLKRLDMSMTRGYKGTNSPSDYRLNTDGRAPHWNFVIPRGEIQNNPAVVNNPDPSGKITPWTDK